MELKPSYQQIQEMGPPKLRGVRLFHNYDEDFTCFAPASLNKRMYAFVVDVLLFWPIFKLAKMPFERKLEWIQATVPGFEYFFFLGLIFVVPYFLYFVFPVAMWGQTLGKYIVGLRVIRDDYGAGVPFPVVLLRESLGKVLVFIPFMIFAFFGGVSSTKKGIHDLFCRTVVITYR